MRRHELVQGIQSIIMSMEASRQRWFVCFGTLLGVVRDRVLDIETDDVDIGVIGNPDGVADGMRGFVRADQIRDPDGTVLNEHYRDQRRGTSVDIYYWQQRGGYYYHTYNVDQLQHDGVLPRYTYKGIPAVCYDPTEEELQRIPNRMRLVERALRPTNTWNKLVPGVETEDMYVPLPYHYGQCLDWWYPDWATRRSNFGQSMAAKTQIVKSLRDLV